MIDAQDIAWGAAGRNSGFVIDLPHELTSDDYAGSEAGDHRQIAENRRAMDFIRQAAAAFGLERFVTARGQLNGAADAAGERALESYGRHLDRLGEPSGALDGEAMQRVIGSGYYRAGIHTPGALLLQPAGYVLGFAEGLRREHGVAIFARTPLTRLEAGRPHRAVTPAGVISAKQVVLAVNGHIESLGLFRHRLMHVFTYASMTRQLTPDERARLGGDDAWGLLPADPMGSTVRRTADHRVVVRGIFSWNPRRGTTPAQVAGTARTHRRSFEARFPQLREVPFEYTWGGHLCLSRNSVPAFGEVAPGVYAAACQNGLGTTRGTLSGLLAAELASGRRDAMLERWLETPPPARLIPEPLLGVGARSYLKWAQARAGRDL